MLGLVRSNQHHHHQPQGPLAADFPTPRRLCPARPPPPLLHTLHSAPGEREIDKTGGRLLIPFFASSTHTRSLSYSVILTMSPAAKTLVKRD